MLRRKLYYNYRRAAGAGRDSRLPLGGDENAELHASGYYAPPFVDTVPMMLRGCIPRWQPAIFAALAQTAHRLKGVFAMLNLVPGKQL